MSENTEEAPEIRDPKAVLEALERAKAEAKQFREESEALRAKIEASSKENPWKARALKAETMVELNKRGIKNTNIAKYINTDDLDVDEEGNIAGLSERIDAAASEFPEIFDVKRAVGGKVDSYKSNPTTENRTVTDRQLDGIFGKG